MDNIADIIRFHRKSAGLSRLKLAQITGLGKTVIYDIEHGKTTVKLDTLLKILDVLNVTMELKSPLMKEFYEKSAGKGK